MIFENMDRIVFAGDSVTDMKSNNPVGEGLFDNVGFGYPRIIENLLAAFYPERYIRVTNSGISGDNSRTLLARFDRDVVELNPDWVSICIGINDVWRQFDVPAMTNKHILPDEYEHNVEEMILKVKGKVKGIFLITPYIIEPNREDRMRKRIDEYCDICRRLAEKHGCTFVDFQKMFEDYCQIRYSALLAWDRIHPNQMGSTLMAREFLKHCEFDYNR
jgi:lysophospholipase L1-like esterase